MIDPAHAAAQIPADYRQPPYKGLTPDHLPGAITISVEQAEAMRLRGTLFIDVSPLSVGGYGTSRGEWVLKADHETIPGAAWLPNVGEASLSISLEQYFANNLDRLTGGDKAAPVIFFCRPDCWMSWNAGRRAIRMGYRRVHWFRDGIPGWRDALLPLTLGTPVPIRP